MKKLIISLVTYNSERYLADFCQSVKAQTYHGWELLVVDNNSYDSSIATVTEYIPEAKIIRQKENIGFSRAHNLVINITKNEYILIVNPDIIMEPDCLERLVAALEDHTDVASVGGKLLYWNFSENFKTTHIDSFGLVMSANYSVHDRFQGQEDRECTPGYAFGFSGALVLFRRSALARVQTPSHYKAGSYEYFDEDFFAYKEDVDLAWRLLGAGLHHYFVPAAVAYHHRAISGARASRAERKQRQAINRLSYRNHLLMLYKNHFWLLTIRFCIPIIWFESAKFWYLLFLDRSSLTGLYEALRMLPRFQKKRRLVLSQRRLRARQFKPWMT